MSRGLQICLALLRIAAGVSLVGPGLHKLGWFMHPALEQTLAGYAAHIDNPIVLRYLHFVTPHSAWLARVVALGELGLGAMLVVGFLTTPAAVLAFVMVANFHFASGKMLSPQYALGQDGLVYVLMFLVLATGRAGLALGADGALGKSMGGGRGAGGAR